MKRYFKREEKYVLKKKVYKISAEARIDTWEFVNCIGNRESQEQEVWV
jgi:hypothetical protein